MATMMEMILVMTMEMITTTAALVVVHLAAVLPVAILPVRLLRHVLPLRAIQILHKTIALCVKFPSRMYLRKS